MTPTSRAVLLLTLATASGAVAAASGPAATSTSSVRLTSISAKPTARGASLVIESTEPAGYVASEPDPLTLFVDLRNVIADGVANRVGNARGPIAGVSIEPAESLGSPVSRVRVSLTQPLKHRLRSDRNAIVVDFEKPSGAPYVAPPISRPLPDPLAALRDNAGPAEPTPALRAAAFNQNPTAAAGQATQQIQAPVQSAPPIAGPEAAGAAGQAGVGAGGQRRFTGNPVSLDFQGADLRAVLRTFSEISGLNMVIDPAVQGTVDVALRDVPWDQALDIILRANRLGYLIDGTIVRIAPLAVLADEEAQRRRLAQEQALAGDLRIITKRLSYARAEELQALLTKSVLSQRGTVQVDPRTNTVIITDLQDRLISATDLIATLDRAQPQVEIEARIVQTTKNFARALGIQWGFGARLDPSLGNTTNLAFPNNGSLTGRTGGTQGAAGTANSSVPTAVNLPAAGATSAVGLALGAINGAFNLDLALSAAETAGNARLLSTPRVSTQNNVEAEIAQGVQIPYQTTANNTVTINFKDAALTLKVTPQITEAGTVIMKIAVDNGSVGPTFGGVPSINTQRANTSVMVNDGQTTVIGGIYASNERTSQDRTPGLSRVPLLRWLFKRDTETDDSSELLIFITPRIIK